MAPRAKLESGKASDSVGGLWAQAVREGGRDRTVHPGRLARSLRKDSPFVDVPLSLVRCAVGS